MLLSWAPVECWFGTRFTDEKWDFGTEHLSHHQLLDQRFSLGHHFLQFGYSLQVFVSTLPVTEFVLRSLQPEKHRRFLEMRKYYSNPTKQKFSFFTVTRLSLGLVRHDWERNRSVLTLQLRMKRKLKALCFKQRNNWKSLIRTDQCNDISIYIWHLSVLLGFVG